MRHYLLLLAFVVVAVPGCESSKSKEASAPPAVQTQSVAPQHNDIKPIKTAADLKGRWKFDVDQMFPSKGGQAEDFAASMNRRNLGDLAVHLDFDGKGRFDLLLSGVPTAGTYSLTGKKLKLVMTTMMGKTPAEWRARRKKTGEMTPFGYPDVSPMVGSVNSSNGTIRIENLGGTHGGGNPVFFKREEVEVKSIAAATASKEELRYVGKWKGKFETKDPSPYPPAILENINLNLREDNTFQLVMMQEAQGAWHLDKGQVVLGDPPGEGVDVRLKFTPSADGKTLVRVDPKSGEKMTFTREGK